MRSALRSGGRERSDRGHTTSLILTAHGSADPRAGANTHAVADLIREMRPGLDVRVAFCEQSTPNLRTVLAERRWVHADPVVTPLLLADAYHARVDIPAIIGDSGAQRASQAGVLGEDDRLIWVLRQRLAEIGVTADDTSVGVIVAAVGSSRADANTRTARVAARLGEVSRWAGVVTAFATGPRPTIGEAAHQLRAGGADRVVIAPWFLAPGKITDGITELAAAQGFSIARPLGAHPLVAATVLDRFDAAVAAIADAA